METRLDESCEIEQTSCCDGAGSYRVPLSRRHYSSSCAVVIFLIPLPMLFVAPAIRDSSLLSFPFLWLLAAFFMLYCMISNCLAYLRDSDRYGLVVDSNGIKEQRPNKELTLKWSEIESILLVEVEESLQIGIRLKRKTWKRKCKLSRSDLTLHNRYIVANSNLVTYLQAWHRKYKVSV